MWETGREREGGKRKTKMKGKELPKEMKAVKKNEKSGERREGRGRRIEEITTTETGSDGERGKRETRTKGKELKKRESRGDEYRDTK